MIQSPTVVQTEAQQAAVIRLTIPRDQIQEVMGPGFSELMATVAAQGIGPAGPWYDYHYRTDPDVFDFEIGVPVSAPVTPTGRVIPGQLPATRVARTVYHGGYEGLGAAWGELGDWVGANGHAGTGVFWEVFTVGPETSEDPADWRTELNQVLAG